MNAAAFLFDLDGTLVDTESTWARAIADFVCEAGGATTADELLPSLVGRNWIDIDRDLHRRFPMLGDSSPADDAVRLRTHYGRYATDPESMVIRPSVEFFRRAAAVAPCAIVSGSPHDDVAAAARLCGIDGVTALILGAGEYERGKPDPSGYLRAAELLGVEPSRCVVVEDSTVGVAAGVAAGMRVLALERGRSVRQDLAAATWRVAELTDFKL